VWHWPGYSTIWANLLKRARIPEAQERDADGNSRRDVNAQLYCPFPQGHYTHIHAAYTGIAFDLLERDFPELGCVNK